MVSVSKHVEQIGYLPEERGLYKSMKVGEQAMYLAQLKGLSNDWVETNSKIAHFPFLQLYSFLFPSAR